MDWDKAYRDHHAEVFAHLYHRSRGNTELARDLAQDVFVRAMRAERQFTDGGRGLMPWLTTIAQNLLADHWKRASTQREALVDEFHDDSMVPSAEAAVIEQWRAETVMAAVARLDEPQRDAVVLSYWGRWPDERIARLTGVSPRTVNTRRWRAREVLRRQLAEVA